MLLHIYTAVADVVPRLGRNNTWKTGPPPILGFNVQIRLSVVNDFEDSYACKGFKASLGASTPQSTLLISYPAPSHSYSLPFVFVV